MHPMGLRKVARPYAVSSENSWGQEEGVSGLYPWVLAIVRLARYQVSKRPMVIICLVTISSPVSDSAPEELTDSAAAGSTT